MRICIQRITSGKVTIVPTGIISGQIGPGVLVLLGVKNTDTLDDARFLASKIAHLRIFEDNNGKMNKSLLEIQGEALVVSQFTLYGDCRKGRRPSFTEAAPSEGAELLYDGFIDFLRKEGVPVRTGVFRQEMDVEIVNSGPVTLLIES